MDQLSSRQISEWEAMDRLDPIGEWVDEFRFARLEALILTIALKWAAGKKTVEPVDVLDFMPDWMGDKEPKKQTVAQMKSILLGLAHDQNKKVANQARIKERRKKNGEHSRINNRGTRDEAKRDNSGRASDDKHAEGNQPGSSKDNKAT